jgi:putative membrane protein insertion efficiency factor
MKPSLPARAAIVFVRAYQRVLSPLLGRRCRFHPTCSAYAVEALRTYGFLKGGLRALWRILRCNPFNPGGYDPLLPDKDQSETRE